MPQKPLSSPRCVALVGPYLAGKTTLLESILAATEAIPRKGTIKDGNTVGDFSPAARSRKMSVELNVASTSFMGEKWTFIDCPGSIEFSHEARTALMVADAAVVVCEPTVERAMTLAPLLKFLDDRQIPHLLFLNKLDAVEIRIRDALAALQAVSARPLVLRQVPIRDDGETVTGYVDLISERAYHYKPGRASDLVPMPQSMAERQKEARQGLLEKLADFDDKLLEQLLEDTVPSKEDIYSHLARNLASDRIVPVLLGAAEKDAGVRRLLKSLRHDVPDPAATLQRLGLASNGGPLAQVFKTQHAAHTGKLSLVRVWSGPIADGATLSDGNTAVKLAGVMRLVGANSTKQARAESGDVAGLMKLDGISTGATLSSRGDVAAAKEAANPGSWPVAPKPLFALAVATEKRGDDVKLSGALQRLCEEDPSLSIEHNHDTNELLLWGQGEMHLTVALERLRTSYHLPVTGHAPQVPYKETIRKGIQQHARHKRQSGGHGQFADVKVEIRPLARGSGFKFEEKIVGGAVPRNFIPAVEEGIRDYLKRGPLGFQVVDVQAVLFDGQYHDVDSSDQAFMTAGALAMREGMPKCDPVLLEPICKVAITIPTDFTSRVQRLVQTRRGHILGYDAKSGWAGWDEVSAMLPQSEMHDLIIELRSATQGVGTFDWNFDHLAELTGKPAEKIVAKMRPQEEKAKAAS
ncbi:MAG TPA: elongation factor G [Alphaproteobacteria bacterium]